MTDDESAMTLIREAARLLKTRPVTPEVAAAIAVERQRLTAALLDPSDGVVKETARAICMGTLPPEDAHRADTLVEHMGDIQLPYWMNFERAARACLRAAAMKITGQ